MDSSYGGKKTELKKTETLGWISVGVVCSALIPAAMLALGYSRPSVAASLLILMTCGMFGLMFWYLRVRVVVGKLYSLTQRLEKEASEQEEALSKLRELEKMKQAMMRMASHQLRAPLAALQSCMSVLLSGAVTEEEDARKLLANAHERGQDMMELVNDILSLAESESVATLENASLEEVDVEKAIRDIANFFSARAAEKNVKYIIDVKSTIGGLKANRKLFNQVVLNLISNAFRYSDPGKDVVITLDAGINNSLILKVRNWGIIISEEDRKNLFKEFWRSNEARKFVERGTGLGLAIVKNIIDFRGGVITVTSDAELGTCFTIEIPRPKKGGETNGETKNSDNRG